MKYKHDEKLSATFRKSGEKKFNVLMDKNVFCIVPHSDAKVYGIYDVRFVDGIKHSGTADAFEKSRFVVQAYDDDGGNYMTYAPTPQQILSRIQLLLHREIMI